MNKFKAWLASDIPIYDSYLFDYFHLLILSPFLLYLCYLLFDLISMMFKDNRYVWFGIKANRFYRKFNSDVSIYYVLETTDNKTKVITMRSTSHLGYVQHLEKSSLYFLSPVCENYIKSKFPRFFLSTQTIKAKLKEEAKKTKLKNSTNRWLK